MRHPDIWRYRRFPLRLGREIFSLLLRVREGRHGSQRTNNGRLACEWLGGFA